VRQLEIKVLDIVDARCNHEVHSTHLLDDSGLATREMYYFKKKNPRMIHNIFRAPALWNLLEVVKSSPHFQRQFIVVNIRILFVPASPK